MSKLSIKSKDFADEIATAMLDQFQPEEQVDILIAIKDILLSRYDARILELKLQLEKATSDFKTIEAL